MSISATDAVVITPAVMTQSLITDLNGDQRSIAALESQIATGNAISRASDDPAGAANILQLQASLTRANQYSTNASDGLGWLQLGNSTVNSVLGVLQNVQSLVESTTGEVLTGSASATAAIAAQIKAALAQLVNLSNTQYEGGQTIFGGTGGSSSAYAADGTVYWDRRPGTSVSSPRSCRTFRRTLRHRLRQRPARTSRTSLPQSATSKGSRAPSERTNRRCRVSLPRP
jgi:flagellin-like hook-associated protein FlgL